uniref:TATA box-binding protein-associated factor RNA polymerase I subunit B isoform X2 n=1 Tax=Myxine glutinosa TaxID=7769 RepID=UPI00358E4132
MSSQIEQSMAGEHCNICGAEDWGVTEESQVFCKTCNCVTERVVESEDPTAHFDPTARIVTLGRGSKGKELFKQAGGRLWNVCEGLQFVLQLQADALISLGICSQVKNDVLCSLWRRYLQKTKQAFTLRAMSTASWVSDDGASEVSYAGSGTNSVTSSISWLSGWTDVSMVSQTSETDASSVDESHVGSVDGSKLYSSRRFDTPHMSLTLSLCYLSLLWINSPLTLLDLIRLAWEGSVPYLHITDKFPDEIIFSKPDASIFGVTRVPSHAELQWEVNKLDVFLALPAFPVPPPQSLVYPPCLAARFLRELNLPDGLLNWCCFMVEHAMKQAKQHAKCLPQRELHAASAVALSLGLLYGLNDEKEWEISAQEAQESAKTVEPVFVFERWYQVEAAKLQMEKSAEQKERRLLRQNMALERPTYQSDKSAQDTAMKYQSLVKSLKSQFLQLNDHSSSSPGHGKDELAKSEYGGEEVCFHGHTLCVSPSWGGPKAWARSFPPPTNKIHTKLMKKGYDSEMSPILSFSMQHLLSLLHKRFGPTPAQLHRAIWELEGHLWSSQRAHARVTQRVTSK